MYQKYVETVAS